jgi:hypothetical protein
MNRTVWKVLGLALGLYTGSYCVHRPGRVIYPDPFFGTEDIWQWTAGDYGSCALLVAAVGLTLAGFRLILLEYFSKLRVNQ